MDVDLDGTAAMNGGEADSAVAAAVDDVLEGVHAEGNASETEASAESEGPGADVC